MLGFSPLVELSSALLKVLALKKTTQNESLVVVILRPFLSRGERHTTLYVGS